MAGSRRMRYKIPGPSKHRQKPNFAQEIKAMAKISKKDVLPEINLPKQKRPYKPRPNARKPHKSPERDLQRHIIWHLRAKGAICGKVKVAATYYKGRYIKDDLLMIGVPDLICFVRNAMWFIEVKTQKGRLSDEQIRFQHLCEQAEINHLVARSVKDTDIIFGLGETHEFY